MDIRKVKSEDAHSLLNLYRQLLPDEEFSLDKTTEFINNVSRSKNYYILVLDNSVKVISTCTLIIINNITHGCKPFGIIENVVTDSSSRGLGYGKMIIKKAIEIATKNNCHKVMVQTRRKENYVHDFYKSCGFSSILSTGLMIDLEEKL